jgi:hypothetical protein
MSKQRMPLMPKIVRGKIVYPQMNLIIKGTKIHFEYNTFTHNGYLFVLSDRDIKRLREYLAIISNLRGLDYEEA